MDRSFNIFLTVALVAGGVVIILVTWLEPMATAERIVPSVIGSLGIIGAIAWKLFFGTRAAKVRIQTTPGKSNVKK